MHLLLSSLFSVLLLLLHQVIDDAVSEAVLLLLTVD